MNDLNLKKAIEKYGQYLGHDFENSERCKNCGMLYIEFSIPSGKILGEGVLCIKALNERKKKGVPRIQSIDKDQFWLLLYNFYKNRLEKNRTNFFASFQETYKYFWSEYKINRSTFTKLFNDIYEEQYHQSKNRLRCHGAPTGSYSDRDRLAMKTSRGDRLWSLWSFDDYDSQSSNYELKEVMVN